MGVILKTWRLVSNALILSSIGLAVYAQYPGMEGVFIGNAISALEINIEDSAMMPMPREVPRNLIAVAESGKRFPLEFLGKRDHHDNRKIFVFRQKEACGEVDGTIVLVTDEFLKEHVPMAVKKRFLEPFTKRELSRIEKAKKLKIKQSWPIATLEDGSNIGYVQFHVKDNKDLSCFVMISKKKIYFIEYKGDMSKYLNWEWGEDNEDIAYAYHEANETPVRIIAAFKSRDGIEIVRTQGDMESEDTLFMRTEGNGFKVILENYFSAH